MWVVIKNGETGKIRVAPFETAREAYLYISETKRQYPNADLEMVEEKEER